MPIRKRSIPQANLGTLIVKRKLLRTEVISDQDLSPQQADFQFSAQKRFEAAKQNVIASEVYRKKVLKLL